MSNKVVRKSELLVNILHINDLIVLYFIIYKTNCYYHFVNMIFFKMCFSFLTWQFVHALITYIWNSSKLFHHIAIDQSMISFVLWNEYIGIKDLWTFTIKITINFYLITKYIYM